MADQFLDGTVARHSDPQETTMTHTSPKSITLPLMPDDQWRRYQDWVQPWKTDLVLRDRMLRLEKVAEQREEWAEKEAQLLERLEAKR